MNEKDVAFFSTLLNEAEDNVRQAFEEGTLGEKVSGLGLMSKSQVDTLKANYAKEVRDSYLGELSEMAKRGEVPQDLYKPIHGAVLEKQEKTLSKQYGIADYEDFADLVEKAISKNKGQSDDAKVQELESLAAQLKEANKLLQKEKEEAVANAEAKLTSQLMARDMADQIGRVPFDLSDVEEDKLDETLNSRKEILSSVFQGRYDTKYIDGKIVVQDKDGNILKNQATLDPIPFENVLLDVAKTVGMKLKSPESGGQGGSSSAKNGSRFKSVDEFTEHCRSKGIVPTSAEGLTLLKESGLKLT